MLQTALGRRIVGFSSALMLVAVTLLAFRLATAPTSGSYEVEAVLARAGAGLGPGSDVKVRGAAVGEVTDLRYEDGRAIATLLMDPEPRLPADVELVVTAKTLLGEKQIELSFDDAAFGNPPYLEAGAQLRAAREPTEFQEVLDELGNVLDAIDPNDLAIVVAALAEQAGTEDTIIANLEVGAELADFAERTAPDVIDRLRSFGNVADDLAQAVPALTEVNRRIRPATRLLVERTADIDDGLARLSTLAIGLAEFLEVEEDLIGRSLAAGDLVGAVLERNMNFVGQYIAGVGGYASGYSEGGPLDDGTEFAYFRIIIGGDDTRSGQTPRGNWLDRLCADAGPLAALMPGCTGEFETRRGANR